MNSDVHSNQGRNQKRRQRRKARKLASHQIETVRRQQVVKPESHPEGHDDSESDDEDACSSQDQGLIIPSSQGCGHGELPQESESRTATCSGAWDGTSWNLQQPGEAVVDPSSAVSPDGHLEMSSPAASSASTSAASTSAASISASSTPAAPTFAQCAPPSDESPGTETSSDRERLRIWAVNHNINHVALNDLLVLLAPKFPGLPTDARTLLHTPRATEIHQCGSGEYIHIGCADGIQRCLRSGFLEGKDSSIMHLSINIDGLPLFSGSSMHVWPILCMSMDTKETTPFPIGIYCGLNKPDDISVFLQNAISELKELLQGGVQCSAGTVSVMLLSVVCDMAARSFAKNVKAHNGYFGCDKCTQKGCWRGRMTYPKVDAPLRTDASFRDAEQPEHHNGASPFMELEDLGMVSQFPVDPMHCVYLGVVRKLLRYWTQKGPRCVRLPSAEIKELSANLLAIKSSMPSEFSRHPRVMREREHWKATECRYFLLYAAPVVLKSVLPGNIYMHYMCLYVAIRILTCVSSSAQMITYAESLLKYFAKQTGRLYGEEAVVYNVHALTHLANDVRKLGALESFSSFPFENHLGMLKRMLRSGHRPLAQLWKRMCEKANAAEHARKPVEMELHGAHDNGPLVEGCAGWAQYLKVRCKLGIIKVSRPDDCVLGDNF